MNDSRTIAIITLNGNSNYGNRFQNYALQQILLKHADSVDTLLIKKAFVNTVRSKNSLPDLIEKVKSYTFIGLIEKSLSLIYCRLLGLRAIKKRSLLRQIFFLSFSKTFINEIDLDIFPQATPNSLGEKYDFFVVGSDQVWNPIFPEFSELFFLTFAPKNKRIAYAPSFGLEELPEGFQEKFSVWLKGMNHLSVREESGAKIIKKLSGKNVPVLLDPTMLLTKEDWLEISHPVKDIPREPFILTYFLGNLDYKLDKEIKNFAKKQHMKIVRINDMTSKYYAIGPSEFLTLIKKASLILTDSFHGTVFSMLFEKPFLTYKRISKNNMQSRIDTLFSIFNIQSRMGMSLGNTNLWNVDYSEVNRLLQIERNKANKYLKSCFTEI